MGVCSAAGCLRIKGETAGTAGTALGAPDRTGGLPWTTILPVLGRFCSTGVCAARLLCGVVGGLQNSSPW